MERHKPVKLTIATYQEAKVLAKHSLKKAAELQNTADDYRKRSLESGAFWQQFLKTSIRYAKEARVFARRAKEWEKYCDDYIKACQGLPLTLVSGKYPI
jgi:hypothetical protein